MRKTINLTRASLLICIIFIGARAHSAHLENITRHYPHGLLGDDFGVLSENDLAANTCGVDVEPFSEKSSAYPYWQCFLTKDASIGCDVTEYDSTEKSPLAILAVTASRRNEEHEYVSRRAIRLSNCNWFKNEWKRIAKHEKYLCLSGPLVGGPELVGGKKSTTWVFDKFKTRKGCVSFFVDQCDLGARLKDGCKVTRSR